MEEKNEKKICQVCGNKLNQESVFCDKCGCELNIQKRKKLSNRYMLPIIFFVVTLLICLTSTVILCHFLVESRVVTNTISDYKNVNITDTGISESVNKVYDSVVIVKTYVKDKLYATGTGFVFKTDDNYGYILTNNHVIESGSDIKVVFTNDEEVTVDVVGTDAYSDIAVLKVSKDKIISVAITGDSSSLKVGDTTFAVGAPLDATTYSWTVTRGILSGKNRIVEVSTTSFASGYVMEVLQTDTAINSGNSGGPLCNANGEVIGITNMKIADSSVEGMGFAIPIETALEYANHFINSDPIIRPYLGISMYDLGNNYFSNQTGIYVQAVENNSPAAKAGLTKGDIIIAINGKNVESSAYLKYELYKHNVGEEIEITYKRNGKEEKAKIILGSYDITT